VTAGAVVVAGCGRGVAAAAQQACRVWRAAVGRRDERRAGGAGRGDERQAEGGARGRAAGGRRDERRAERGEGTSGGRDEERLTGVMHAWVGRCGVGTIAAWLSSMRTQRFTWAGTARVGRLVSRVS